MKKFQAGHKVQQGHYKSFQPNPINRILKLQKQVDSQIKTLGSRTANARKVIDYLYQHPMIDAAKAGEAAEISPASAYKLVADLKQFGILKEITGGRRGRMYVFDAYLQLFK